METISPEYREMNRRLHQDMPEYGANGHRSAGVVAGIAEQIGTREVLDYGCGKGTLGVTLRARSFAVREFDPAIAGKDTPPEPADLVYCGDVAEHIEPEYLEAFLEDLRRVTRSVLILTVATRPAKKTLADGRNAHLIQEPLAWWLPLLTARFDMRQVVAIPSEFAFIGKAK